MAKSKWTNQAGPRRFKPVEQLCRDIDWQAATTIERYRAFDGTIMQTESTVLFGQRRPEPLQKLQELGERYAWTATVDNVKGLIADLETLLAWTKETRPVLDKTAVA